MFITTECAAELSVCMVVLVCGCPIYVSVIICGTASQALMNIALIYALAADVITALIIREKFNTASLFAGMAASFDKKNVLLLCFLSLKCLRYEALL